MARRRFTRCVPELIWRTECIETKRRFGAPDLKKSPLVLEDVPGAHGIEEPRMGQTTQNPRITQVR